MPKMIDKSKTYDGRECPYGHGTERYRADNSCVTCQKEKSKSRWESGEKKPSKYDPMYRREHQLKREYGISHADYEAMAIAQGHGCAICGQPPFKPYFDVDHDHKTGKVRGLLCHPCNLGLGGFSDDPDKLRRAISYLSRR